MTEHPVHHDHTVTWERPDPARNYRIEILCCHCDSTTDISIPSGAPEQEYAFTCGNCQTIHWLTITNAPTEAGADD